MKEIKASMAGTVLNVLVSVGEEITEGQQVIVLESMKMEIPIESTASGKVQAINVNIGEFVNEDDTLVVVE